MSSFSRFANFPKELQVHIRKMVSTTDDTAHLHESSLYAALMHRIRPMEEASIYPSFLILISRYRAKDEGYWAFWVALRGKCHISEQLVLKQLLSLNPLSVLNTSCGPQFRERTQKGSSWTRSRSSSWADEVVIALCIALRYAVFFRRPSLTS